MEQNPGQRAWLRPHRIVLVLAVLAALTILVASLPGPQPAPPPPILILPRSYVAPPPKTPLFARLVPPTKAFAWLWHLKEAICGKVSSIQIDAQIVTLPSVAQRFLPQPKAGSEYTEEPGLKVWVLPQRDLSGLQQQLKQVSGVEFVNSARLLTGDGIDASLYVGESLTVNGTTNDLGLKLTCLPRFRAELTDLTVLASYVSATTNAASSDLPRTESPAITLHTNLDAKVRFQLPKGKGILVLQSLPMAKTGNATAVILSTKR